MVNHWKSRGLLEDGEGSDDAADAAAAAAAAETKQDSDGDYDDHDDSDGDDAVSKDKREMDSAVLIHTFIYAIYRSECAAVVFHPHTQDSASLDDKLTVTNDQNYDDNNDSSDISEDDVLAFSKFEDPYFGEIDYEQIYRCCLDLEIVA